MATTAERRAEGADGLGKAVCTAPDRLEEACGVFAVYAPGEEVARLTG